MFTFKQRFRRKLLSWYEKHHRRMPWRETKDPYSIWISEVMLQQTPVKKVIHYYRCFIDRFSTVQELAKAPLHEVMKKWEGLGYYSRARSLHEAAQEIVTRFEGKVPDTIQDLLSLPGVGRYTAGAVLSIAFGKAVPILDGNVVRVLSRIFHVTENVSKTETQKRLWLLAEKILPKNRTREFNQGLMEMGAVVCKPKRPQCNFCPLSRLCKARKLNIQESLPVRSPRKSVPHYDVTAGIIWKGKKFLITLRPPRGLLGGLWEFPGGKKEIWESLETCLRREIKEELDIDIQVEDHLISVKHAYTHFRITLHVFQCRYQGGRIQPRECDDYRWITPAELNAYAFPGADRKAVQMLIEKRVGGFS